MFTVHCSVTIFLQVSEAKFVQNSNQVYVLCGAYIFTDNVFMNYPLAIDALLYLVKLTYVTYISNQDK